MSRALTRRAAMLGAGSAASAVIVGAGALVFHTDCAHATVSTSPLAAIMEAHRDADAALKLAVKAYDTAFHSGALPPWPRVVISRNHDTKEPRYADCDGAIDGWFDRVKIGVSSFDQVTERRRTAAKAELAMLRANYDAAYERLGVLRLENESDAASNAEFDAFEALVKYEPATIAEMKAKALYLIEVLSVDRYDRLEAWNAELLASFAGIAPVEVTV